MFNISLAKSNKHDNHLIPRRVLFGNPDKISVTLSHDGKHLAYIAPYEGTLNVWIAPVQDISQAEAITADHERGIREYIWAYDNEHIFYTQDYKGDENFRIYSYSLKTKQTKLLTPERGVRAGIYGISERQPDIVLIGSNARDTRYFDIHKLNLATGIMELLIENNKFISFIIDNDLNIRFAKFTNRNGDDEYFELANQGDWIPYMTVAIEDAVNTGFIGFDNSGQLAYLKDSRGRNTAALRELNLVTKESRLIAEDARADISILTSHPTQNTIQAIAVNYDIVTYNILDKAIKEDIEYLQNLDKGNISINSRTQDDQVWLVAFLSDTMPVKYYKYNRPEKKAEFLFTNRKALENYRLAPMQPVIIKSRDGLNLVSYLTLPISAKANNLQPDKPLPMVLYVHGGPFVRDSWGLDPVHQWLANRGYGVLSVNYRGSAGFGKNFVNAANRQWSKKMHDDLIDAVNWALENKIADPAKIAIMGGSYGGYATLVGLTLTPDIFACGVDIVGPSNLLTLVQTVPPYWIGALNRWKQQIGDWETEEGKKLLTEASPLTHAEQINKPLFIAQGANDPRVKQAESDQIVEAMRSKNIPVIYALYPDEGHGFVKAENRLSYYALIEQFLGKILKEKIEPIGEDLKGANFLVNDSKVTSTEAEKIINNAIK